MSDSSFDIFQAASGEELGEARELFREYARGLGVSLCFQGFEEELAGLPGKYAPPDGCLLLAKVEGTWAGCVALRPLEGEVCEMKRLSVRPAFQGRGFGRALARRCLAEAHAIGYRVMRLDTLRRLRAALGLYASMGFVEISPYCANPHEDVVYLEKILHPDSMEFH